MNLEQAFFIHPISESLLTISFGNSISTEINKRVFKAYQALLKNKHGAWLDIIPAYSTVSIAYDVLSIRKQHASAFQCVKEEVERIITQASSSEEITSRKVEIPVCYDPEFGLDIERIKKEKGVSTEELIQIHSSQSYQVFMIGFLPGFAYMGSVDARIATPRIPTPRTHVPAGSVGIAGEQTGIYPLDSPGGWNIIGKTSVKLFDPKREEPVLLKPGDRVTFTPITKEKFNSSTFKILEA